jgi:hypothetical protein
LARRRVECGDGGRRGLVPLWAAMLMWLLLWILYLSIVNVGLARPRAIR